MPVFERAFSSDSGWRAGLLLLPIRIGIGDSFVSILHW
jgi:hypothetical protein